MDVGYDLAGGLNGPCLPSRDVADVLPCQVNTVIRLAEGRVVGFPVVGGIGYPAAFLVFSPFPVDGKGCLELLRILWMDLGALRQRKALALGIRHGSEFIGSAPYA